MKMENNNLDTILKSKLTENSIPFKESYWNAANKILLENRKKSNKIYLLTLPVLLALVSLFMFKSNYFTTNQTGLLNSTEIPAIVSTNAKTEPNNKEISAKNEDLNNLNKSDNSVSSNTSSIPTNNSSQKSNSSKSATKQNLSTTITKNQTENSNISDVEKNYSNKSEPQISETEKLLESNSISLTEKNNYPILLESYLFKGFNIKPKNNKKQIEIATFNPNKKRKLIHSYTSLNFGLQTNANLRPSYQMNVLWHIVTSQQLSFYTGLGLFQTSPELGKRTYNETSYSFGESNKSISIDTRKLYYLNIPLGAEFKIKGRHEFSSGLNYLYLLSSKDEFYYYNNGILFDKKTKDSHISLFKQSDVLLELNYAYWLNTKSKLSLGYYHGLRAITDVKVFETSDKNRNYGLRLGLQYNLN